jgi:cell division septum initiation protein DivIVA
MHVNDLLNELSAKLQAAKKQSLGRGFLIGEKDELLSLVDDVRALLPTVVHEADELLKKRDELIQDAKAQAAKIIEQANIQREKLASSHEVLLTAAAEAEAIREDVAAEVAKLRAEADDYIDKQLARFEVALTKVLASVRKGRERISPESGFEDLSERD